MPQVHANYATIAAHFEFIHLAAIEIYAEKDHEG